MAHYYDVDTFSRSSLIVKPKMASLFNNDDFLMVHNGEPRAIFYTGNKCMKPSQLASQLRRIASKIEASKKPDRDLVARDLKRTLAALAAGAGTFSPRPGDDVAVTPAGGENEFRVEGILDGVTLAGVAVTHRDSGLEFRSDDGSELSESVYDTLCDIMGDADPSWMSDIL